MRCFSVPQQQRRPRHLALDSVVRLQCMSLDARNTGDGVVPRCTDGDGSSFWDDGSRKHQIQTTVLIRQLTLYGEMQRGRKM